MQHNVNAQCDNVPSELCQLPQWVTWRFESTEDDGHSKVLYNAHSGAKASTTNPKTWSDFPTALKAAHSRQHDGVGFVLSKNDPYVGIDMNGCIDDGHVADWAMVIIQMLDSYTEISPSGDGVTIWVKGSILSSLKVPYQTGSVEMHQDGMCLSVTDRHLSDTSGTIRSANSDLTDLHRRLLQIRQETQPNDQGQTTNHENPPLDKRSDEHIKRGLANAASEVAAALGDARNNSLNRSAFKLGPLVATCGYSCGHIDTIVDRPVRQSSTKRDEEWMPAKDQGEDDDNRWRAQGLWPPLKQDGESREIAKKRTLSRKPKHPRIHPRIHRRNGEKARLLLILRQE